MQLGIDGGYFEPLETAATSLLVRSLRPIDAGLLSTMDQRLQAGATEPLVERAIKLFSAFEVDRPEQFVSRLYLAAMQSVFERGDHFQSSRWLLQLQQRLGGALPPAVVADLADLARYGFSLRRLYERDIDALGR